MTIAELVAASRSAQGLPVRVEDPATVSRLAVLLIGHDHKTRGGDTVGVVAGAELPRPSLLRSGGRSARVTRP